MTANLAIVYPQPAGSKAWSITLFEKIYLNAHFDFVFLPYLCGTKNQRAYPDKLNMDNEEIESRIKLATKAYWLGSEVTATPFYTELTEDERDQFDYFYTDLQKYLGLIPYEEGELDDFDDDDDDDDDDEDDDDDRLDFSFVGERVWQFIKENATDGRQVPESLLQLADLAIPWVYPLINDAALQYGDFLTSRPGIAENQWERAVRAYNEYAAEFPTTGFMRLGDLYSRPDNPLADPFAAFRHYGVAAAMGSVPGMCRMGDFFRDGAGKKGKKDPCFHPWAAFTLYCRAYDLLLTEAEDEDAKVDLRREVIRRENELAYPDVALRLAPFYITNAEAGGICTDMGNYRDNDKALKIYKDAQSHAFDILLDPDFPSDREALRLQLCQKLSDLSRAIDLLTRIMLNHRPGL